MSGLTGLQTDKRTIVQSALVPTRTESKYGSGAVSYTPLLILPAHPFPDATFHRRAGAHVSVQRSGCRRRLGSRLDLHPVVCVPGNVLGQVGKEAVGCHRCLGFPADCDFFRWVDRSLDNCIHHLPRIIHQDHARRAAAIVGGTGHDGHDLDATEVVQPKLLVQRGAKPVHCVLRGRVDGPIGQWNLALH